MTCGKTEIVNIDEKELDGYYYNLIELINNLLILGGGYVGYAIYELADILGFEVTVYDDRPEFVTKERFPKAVGLESGNLKDILNNILKIKKELKYVGLIGS